MKSMIPKIRVKPAASKNSKTPSCSPFSSWTIRRVQSMGRRQDKAGGDAQASPPANVTQTGKGLHFALGSIGILVIGVDGFDDFGRPVAVGIDCRFS